MREARASESIRTLLPDTCGLKDWKAPAKSSQSPLRHSSFQTLNQSWVWLTHTPRAVWKMEREEVISFWIQQIFHCLTVDWEFPAAAPVTEFFFLGHFWGCTAEQIYQVQHLQTIAGWCARAHRWLINNLLKKTFHHIQDNAQNIMENVLSAFPGSAHTWHHHYTATYVPWSAPNQRAISKFPSRLYLKYPLQKWYLIAPTTSKNTIISRICNILSLKIAHIKAHCYQIKLPASLKWNKSSEHQFPPHNLLRPF